MVFGGTANTQNLWEQRTGVTVVEGALQKGPSSSRVLLAPRPLPLSFVTAVPAFICPEESLASVQLAYAGCAVCKCIL